MAVSSEKAEAMKFARSINVFVGPEDAMLLKKCMHDGKASFDAELMEKSEQVGVNVDVSADRIIIKSKTKSKSFLFKEILYKNITAIQESMAPTAFTMYASGEQALYLTCAKRGLLLGCISAFKQKKKVGFTNCLLT